MKNLFLKITGILVAVLIVVIWGTNSISIGRYTVNNKKIPSEFDGFRIVQVSDLHNKGFGRDQKRLMDNIKKENPDIIVITGDLVDRRKWGFKNARSFLKQASEIAPIYYVSGNHEVWSGKYEYVKKVLSEYGVIILDDKSTSIKIKNQEIYISGIIDTGFEDREDYVDEILQEVSRDVCSSDRFSILLSHRPEHIEEYSNAGFDLVYSGHAHGGQIRIPFIGGIYAPHQGFMPKYDDGKIKYNNTEMIVSRGLGNSVIPIRIFNRPEITVTELECD